MFMRVALLLLGVFACSTSVIMIKAGQMDPILLAAFRQILAALLLLPLFMRDRRIDPFAQTNRMAPWKGSVISGVLLAFHFITWNMGARLTSAANATLIVNMVPVAMPFLLLAVAHERLNKWEIIGTALAMAGTMVMGWSDFHISRESLLGDAMCFVSMLLFAAYLVLAKRYRQTASLWVYVVPLYLTGGAACLLAGLPFSDWNHLNSGWDWLMVLGLALIPTISGHTILNYSMRTLRGQTVSIVNLGQFVPAGVMAFFMLGETPAPSFYAAAVLIAAGAVLAIRFAPGNGE